MILFPVGGKLGRKCWLHGIEHSAMEETESRHFFRFLMAEIFGEEIGHDVQGFGGFGELEVVPEGVG
jgi:hypothetical protein